MSSDKDKFNELIRLLRINYMMRDYRLGKNVTIDKDELRDIVERPLGTELVEMKIEAGKTLPEPANIPARHPPYPKTPPPEIPEPANIPARHPAYPKMSDYHPTPDTPLEYLDKKIRSIRIQGLDDETIKFFNDERAIIDTLKKGEKSKKIKEVTKNAEKIIKDKIESMRRPYTKPEKIPMEEYVDILDQPLTTIFKHID